MNMRMRTPRFHPGRFISSRRAYRGGDLLLSMRIVDRAATNDRGIKMNEIYDRPAQATSSWKTCDFRDVAGSKSCQEEVSLFHDRGESLDSVSDPRERSTRTRCSTYVLLI